MKLRIGSRGSQLALWQAHHIAGLLRGEGHEVDVSCPVCGGFYCDSILVLEHPRQKIGSRQDPFIN